MALYGIYGSHTTEMCPWLNEKTGRLVVGQVKRGFAAQAQKYSIREIVGQFHSALEHTFLWIVDADDPHKIQQFAVDAGVASFNNIRIVPLITFAEVVKGVQQIHKLSA
jgi:hypothetical protein